MRRRTLAPRSPSTRVLVFAAAAGALALAAGAPPAPAQVASEEIGRVEVLPAPPHAHWAWASDPVLRRIALVDLDAGDMLGMVNGGWGFTTAVFASARPEFYVPETHYSRGSRGERTDVVTFYDTSSLAPTGEVVIPPRRALNVLPSANAALGDDERFLAIFNMTPATSLSIVDVVERRFVAEVSTPGCSLVYAAGPRRFAMLCGNGEMLLVALGADGAVASKRRTQRFFDPQTDPVTEKAVRWGSRWVFVSFAGSAHVVDLAGEEPVFEAPFALVSERERADGWRVGGVQHLAIHAASGRLYSLMHRGGDGSHKQEGTELWVYDLATRERSQRLELRSPGLTVMGISLAFGESWPAPFDRVYGWLIDAFAADLGVGEIAVTPDAEPLLVTAANYTGSLGVYDALTGEFLRRVLSGNVATVALQAPWGGAR